MQAIGLILAEIGWAIAGLGVGGYTAVAIGAAVVVGGSIAAAKAMGLFEIEMPQMDSDASRQTTVKSTVAPQKIIYGEALVSGPISYIALAGANNADLYQTIVLAGHKVNAITDVYFDDELITNAQIAAGLNTGSNTAGNVTGGRFGPIDSNTICIINKHLGTASDASDPMLTNKFDLYTSAHRGEGIAYLAMKWTLDEDSAEVWEKYSPGNVKALVQGKQVYDPRLEVTAGGTAGANPTTAAYVAYSTNPALCVTDYLIDQTLGMGIAAAKIDWAAVITAANGCDVDVDVPNSATQKRFTANGVLFGTDSHQKNINKLLSSMNGRLIYSNGKYIVKAGIYEAPTEVLTEDDLIGAIQIKTSLERSDRFNTIRGIFVDASANNKSTEFPKVQLTQAVTRDNGEVLEKEIQLPMVSDSYQAQRIANKLIQLSDQQKIVSFPANLSALRITAGDRVRVTVEELSWNQKVFECIGWTFSDEGGVNLTLREDSSLSYDDPLPAAYSQITSDGTISDGFRGVPSPSGLRAASGEKKVFLNWVNPGKPSDFGTVEVYASASNNVANAVKIGETDGTQFVHDGNNAADQIAVGDTRVYWVRSKKNVGTVAENAVSVYQPNSTTGVGPVTVLATLVDWDNVADPTIGIDINSDTISINTGVANTTTGQAVATSGIEAGTTVTQGGITMNQGGSIKGGQSAFNSGTGFFLGYSTNAYKFSIGNASNEALTFDGSNLSITGAITATSGTFTGTVNASAGAFTGDVSTDSKFVAGSGATSATMDGGDQDYRIYAGGATPDSSSFKVDSAGIVTATRLVVTRPDDLSAVIFDSERDGLVGIGLSSISQDTGIVVQAPAVELTSQTNTVSVVLTASQTLTLETILALPTAKKNAGNYTTTKYPESITATMQYSTNSGSSWSTFGAAVALTRTAVTSPSDASKFGVLTQAVDGNGRTGYRRDVHAIDNINNIHFIKSVSGFAAGSYLFRVQLSFVAGSSPDTDYEPNITGNRTLQFGTDGAGFTVDEYGVITDSPSGTATIGYVQANYVALDNGNTITVGSGETNTFEDESSNEILVVSDTEVVARNLFRATWNGAQPTSTKIIRVTNAAGTAERFSVTEDGSLTTSTLGVTGNAIITGDLTVNGTTTTVNTDNLTVKDNNITLNYATGDSSSTADDAGITIQDAVDASNDATILWKTATDTFEFSHPLTVNGIVTTAGVSGYAHNLLRSDNRTIAPDDVSGHRLTFGFTSWANNNTSPYADYLHLRSYNDASGGSDNLVMFKKSGIGMRIWQQTFGSSTAYASYEDVWHTGNLTTTNKTNYDTAYTYSQVGHLPLAGGTLTGALSGTAGTFSGAVSGASFELSGISVIDSSQNINAASISTSGITSTGDIVLTTTLGTSPAVTFNTSTATDPGVDMAIRLDAAEGLSFYEPEDTNKVHFKILDDTGVDAPFGYWVNGTRMADASRNLTVGTITSGELNGTTINSLSAIGASDDVRTGLRHHDTSAMAAGVGGQLVLGYKYKTDGSLTEGAIIKTYKENANNNEYGSGLKFQVRNTGVALSTKMTLDPSGNLTTVGSLNTNYISAKRDIRSAGQIRATGWYNDAADTNYTDFGFEIGVSGSSAFALAYNRDTNSFGPMQFNATNFTFNNPIIATALTLTGNIQQNYGGEFRGKDSGGTIRTMLRISSDTYQIGWSGAGDVEFMGGGSYTKRMGIDGSTGNVSVTTSMISTKAQHTADTSTNAHFKVLPSATTNTTGLSSVFLATSTVDGYGVSINGARKGSTGIPTFTIRAHNNSTTGTEILTISSGGDLVSTGSIRVNATSASSYASVSAMWTSGVGMIMQYYPNTAVGDIDNNYARHATQVYGDIRIRQNVGGTMTTRLLFDNSDQSALFSVPIKMENGSVVYLYTSSSSLRGYLGAVETASGTNAGLVISASSGEAITFKDGGMLGTRNVEITGGGHLNLFHSLLANGTEVIDTSRNLVNIGSITSGGISAYSAIGAADNIRLGLRHYDTTAMAAGVGGQLVLGYKYESGGTYTEGAIIKMYKENAVNGEYGSGLKFQVRNHAANLSTKMRLTPSGVLSAGDVIAGYDYYTPTGALIGALRAYGGVNAFVSASDEAGRTAFFGVDNSGYAMFGALTNHNTVIRANNSEKLTIQTNGVINIAVNGTLAMNGQQVISASRALTNITSFNGYYPTQAASTSQLNSIVSYDTRSISDTPSSRPRGFYVDFKTQSVIGLTGSGTYAGVLTFRAYGSSTDLSGGPPIQIAYDTAGKLQTRVGNNTSTWQSWKDIHLAGNSLAASTIVASDIVNTNRDVRSAGQVRATGWYNDAATTDYTGFGFEIGVSGGSAFALSYNRNTATYGPMQFNADNFTFNNIINCTGISASSTIVAANTITSNSYIGPGDNERGGLRHYDTTYSAAGVGGQLVLGYKYSGNTYTEGALIRTYKENGSQGQYGSGLKFQVRNHGFGLSTKLTLDPSGNLTSTGNVTAYSDKRLKQKIQTLDGSKVLQMRGVSFTKDGREGSGVIAQELELIASELVHTSDDEMGTKSVAYGNLVGYLIENAKQQQTEINELKALVKLLMEK